MGPTLGIFGKLVHAAKRCVVKRCAVASTACLITIAVIAACAEMRRTVESRSTDGNCSNPALVAVRVEVAGAPIDALASIWVGERSAGRLGVYPWRMVSNEVVVRPGHESRIFVDEAYLLYGDSSYGRDLRLRIAPINCSVSVAWINFDGSEALATRSITVDNPTFLPAARIRGRVLDARGEALSGIALQLVEVNEFGIDAIGVPVNVLSDNEGVFEFRRVRHGCVQMCIDDDRYMRNYRDVRVSGAELDVGNIIADVGRDLIFTINNAVGDCSGIELYAYTRRDFCDRYFAYATSLPEFRFRNVKASSYIVYTYPRDIGEYSPEASPHSIRLPPLTRISMRDDESLRGQVECLALYKVSPEGDEVQIFRWLRVRGSGSGDPVVNESLVSNRKWSVRRLRADGSAVELPAEAVSVTR